MILKVNCYDVNQINNFVKDYYKQIDDRKIEPEWIENLGPHVISPDSTLVAAKSNKGIFEGIIHYRKQYHSLNNVLVSDYFPLDEIFNEEGEYSEKVTFSDLKSYEGQKNIAQLINMESFVKGVGRTLINHLISEPDIDYVFLSSMTEATTFYEKMGFKKSGYYTHISKQLPIMEWKK